MSGWAHLHLLVSGAAFFVVTTSLTHIAVGLAAGDRMGRSMRRDFRCQGFTDAVLLGLSPIGVIAWQRGSPSSP